MIWRRAHWVVGTATLLVFLLSGAYMRWMRDPPVAALTDTVRAVYRSRHLFLMLAALANLAMSMGWQPQARRGARWAQRLASVLALIAPFLLVPAFLTEPPRGIEPASLSRYGLYALFLAAAILAILGRPDKP
jgi:peptidoglycan/LPS O-acetylase OafA/YrhL